MTKRFQSREVRQKVFLIARARFGDMSWRDARIWDVSSRGMMLTVSTPATPGSPVEIMRGPVAYRGRVAWTAGDRCGVRIEENVDLEYLIGRTGSPAKATLRPTPIGSRAAAAAGLPPRVGHMLKQAGRSAARTRASLAQQLAGTIQRVQTAIQR